MPLIPNLTKRMGERTGGYGVLGRFDFRARCLVAGDFPGSGGEQLHGWLFDIMREHDEVLAGELHGAIAKPFTISGLRGGVERPDGDREVVTGDECSFSITSLSQQVYDVLQLVCRLFPGREFGLGSARFIGLEATEKEDARATYDSLALNQRPSKLVVVFRTPTSFRRQGEQVLFPLPGLVFGSLASRWNAFAPWALPSDRFAEFELLRVSRYELRTSVVKFSRFVLLGFVGRITYTLPRDMPAPIVVMIAALGRYAPYAGVGYRTTMGMGGVETDIRWTSAGVS